MSAGAIVKKTIAIYEEDYYRLKEIKKKIKDKKTKSMADVVKFLIQYYLEKKANHKSPRESDT